ncbi:ATP-binding cassette domain-containing protein [Geomicrobium sp. JCM 19038]|uniref:ATP-binding cassette domain-containing protein n=1 Tax=Geomicrobium sp. JCM 19038 TaxID=1460635 RepID=UPI00045F16E0|nr:ATP-binding cassette domain-containing protein [Geomicrobium sp. JCM 19038]GAK09420.1 methionine ABC transporter ATP-binding protein [Geomicrobium sp. JCM 19038]
MIAIQNLSFASMIENTNVSFQLGLNYIYGKNGSGKSTFLDCLSGIIHNYSGTITGNDDLVYMNQNLYFSMKLKVKDYVQFVLTLDRVKHTYNDYFAYIESISLKTFLDEAWNSEVSMLSGGERRKLFFVTTCYLDREWYVFDEPFAGVDDEGKQLLTTILERLVASKKGVLFTSHERIPFENMDATMYTLENKQIYTPFEQKQTATSNH